jgi:hypothetical protein
MMKGIESHTENVNVILAVLIVVRAAAVTEKVPISVDQHPSDSTFLPEVNDLASELRQTACSPSARRDPSSWMHSNRTRYSRFR